MSTIANFAQKVGNGIGYAANLVGNFAANPQVQREAAQQLASGIDTVYEKLSIALHRANSTMVTDGEGTLNAPIKRMSERKAEHYTIEKFDANASLKKIGNALIDYHTKVINNGEEFSRKAGSLAHSLVSAALTPVRILSKALKIEIVGQLIQNSIALAVGFAVRGIFLFLSQLGHLVPYLTALLAAGAVAAGFAALTIYVSPFAAAGTAIALAFLIQQLQINSLRTENKSLAKNLDQQNTEIANQNTAILGKINDLASDPLGIRRTFSAVVAGTTSAIKATARGIATAASAVASTGKAAASHKHAGKVAGLAVVAGLVTLGAIYAPGVFSSAAQTVSSYVFGNSSNVNVSNPELAVPTVLGQCAMPSFSPVVNKIADFLAKVLPLVPQTRLLPPSMPAILTNVSAA